MVDLANSVFRDFVTDGVPASGTNKPVKSKIRQWGAWLETAINAGLSNGGLIYSSLALMNADLLHGANSSAWVIGDATVANNGIYKKIGASGTGSWSRVADLPYSFISATDAGAGTANAIVATTVVPLPVNDAATLIALNIFRNNTGTPATVAFNGGSALTIKTNNGNDVQAGYLVAGMIVAGYVSGSTFRLISDVASSADRAAAEAAAANSAASAAAAAASASSINLPSPVASTFLQRNAGNTAYVTQTAAQVMETVSPATTRGDILFRNATNMARLAASTAGYLLQTNGAGTDPTYAGFLQAGTGAVALAWQIKAREIVSVIDYGGVGDNATDNLAAFNAANTYLVSIGGGTIYVPAGIFRVSGAVALSSKVSVAGTGQGSVIRTTSATADIFQPAGNQMISGLYFDSSVARTAGGAIKMDGVGQIIIANNYFTGMWASIWITNACSLIWVQTNTIYIKADSTAYGIRIDGPSAVGNDYFIQNNFIRSLSQGTQPLAGIYVDRSGGTYLSNNSVLWCGTGLMLRAASGTTLTWTFSLNDVFDTNNAIGVSISASTGGTIKGVFFDGVWSSTNGQDGINIANGGGTIDGVQINNPRIFNNSFYGITVASGPINVAIRNGATCGNSGASAGTYHGINFAAGCTNFSVMGVTSGAAYGFSASQGYGIVVQSGASNNYEITNNIVQGNATGGILDLGSGTTRRIEGNLGYNPVGSQTLSPGASPWTYTASASPETIYISATTGVSAITQNGNSILPVALGANVPFTIGSGPGETVVITYTGTLTAKRMIH